MKWRGLGPSEYVSLDGAWLVQLHGRRWHLFPRVPAVAALAGPGTWSTWTWGPSVFGDARKGACQDHARTAPQPGANSPQEAPRRPPESAQPPGATGRAPRGALGASLPEAGPTHNARCHECGVPFNRDSKHRHGPLCGGNCLADVREILAEATP